MALDKCLLCLHLITHDAASAEHVGAGDIVLLSGDLYLIRVIVYALIRCSEGSIHMSYPELVKSIT